MRRRAAGIGMTTPTATHGENSGAGLDGGGEGSEHQVRVLYITISGAGDLEVRAKEV